MADDDTKVVKLIDRYRGQTPESLQAWAAAWLASEAFDDTTLRSIVILVERPDGYVGCISQSTHSLDVLRLQGLLARLQHRIEHGRGLGLSRDTDAL